MDDPQKNGVTVIVKSTVSSNAAKDALLIKHTDEPRKKIVADLGSSFREIRVPDSMDLGSCSGSPLGVEESFHENSAMIDVHEARTALSVPSTMFFFGNRITEKMDRAFKERC